MIPRVARSSLKELIAAGLLTPGQRLVAIHRGARHTAEITAEGVVRVDGDGLFRSPSSAAGSITGHNTNGWQFWHIEQSGKPLADARPAPTDD